jgi:hypothetical protein
MEQSAPAERHVHGAPAEPVHIGEGGPSGEIDRDWPNIGPRVSIHSSKGEVLARLGKMHAGLEPGHFTPPHGMAVDRHATSLSVNCPGAAGAALPKARRQSASPFCTSLKKIAG